MTSTAFLGLGVMGGGMAGRLVGGGVPLAVWNRRRDRAEPFGSKGATIAASCRGAASGADVVLAMVADDEASRSVWLGPDGALAGAKPGSVLIECSTLSPGWILELAEQAAAHGCDFLDAPVTGSKTHAASGQLLFLVGGPAEVLERARPILALMSRDIVHLGPTGSGSRLKLVNNFMCGVQAAALAEAVVFLERAGLDRDAALAMLSKGAPGSPLVGAVGPRMATSDFTVNFSLTLMRKDLSYAIAEAERMGLRLRTAAGARELYDAAIAAHLGHADFSAIVEPLRSRSG